MPFRNLHLVVLALVVDHDQLHPGRWCLRGLLLVWVFAGFRSPVSFRVPQPEASPLNTTSTGIEPIISAAGGPHRPLYADCPRRRCGASSANTIAFDTKIARRSSWFPLDVAANHAPTKGFASLRYCGSGWITSG
jgi:hypothetical protein